MSLRHTYEPTARPVRIFFNLDFLVELTAKGFSYSMIAAIIFSTRSSLSIIDCLLNSFFFFYFLLSTNIFEVSTNHSSEVCSHCPFFNGVLILGYINYPTFCLGISIHTCMQRKRILFTETRELFLIILFKIFSYYDI